MCYDRANIPAASAGSRNVISRIYSVERNLMQSQAEAMRFIEI